MAHFGKDLEDFKGHRCIRIHSAQQTENYTIYMITVTVGAYSWTVGHRYSEFYELHEKLCASYKLDRSLLPPKKLFGNQSESFVKKRQRELEIYLQTIILYLAQRLPSCLAYFLDFDKYEIHGITQAMAEDLYNRGESLLQTREKYEVTSLQLYSLTERLKLPEPTCDSGDVKKDLGHILDFITRAKNLKVLCSKKPVGTSNIVMNKLPFDLTLFKSLQTLELCGCNFRLVAGMEIVKQTLFKLEVHESSSSLKEILLQDAPHWKLEDGSLIVGYWDMVTEANLSHNSFSEIPDSIQLLPNLEKLDLSYNEIGCIQNLHWLSQLTELNLSHNQLSHVDSLHTKLGNVKVICMAYNQLESLHGFSKLFSLQTLDMSHNKIYALEEMRYISHLPCVENLILEGNTVTGALDYRTKVLEMFGDRVREVKLDRRISDQKELDTVAVLQALRKAKDVKIIKKSKRNTSVASLTDSMEQSPYGSLTDQASDFPAPGEKGGPFSRSMPTGASTWARREIDFSVRSHSPHSQDSTSSYASNLDEEGPVEPIPEAHPYDMIIPSTPPRRSMQPKVEQPLNRAISDRLATEKARRRASQPSPVHMSSQKQSGRRSVPTTSEYLASKLTLSGSPKVKSLLQQQKSGSSSSLVTSQEVQEPVVQTSRQELETNYQIPAQVDDDSCIDNMATPTATPIVSSIPQSEQSYENTASDVDSESISASDEATNTAEEGEDDNEENSGDDKLSEAAALTEGTEPEKSASEDDADQDAEDDYLVIADSVPQGNKLHVVTDDELPVELQRNIHEQLILDNKLREGGELQVNDEQLVSENEKVETRKDAQKEDILNKTENSDARKVKVEEESNSKDDAESENDSNKNVMTAEKSETNKINYGGLSPISSNSTDADNILENGNEGSNVPDPSVGANKSTPKRQRSLTYNAADLPTQTNSSFVTWIVSQFLNPSEDTESSGKHTSIEGKGVKEMVVDIVWGYGEQLSQPGLLFPCCIILSSSTVYIERLIGLESSFPGVPDLEPCSILPLSNIQQIVVGHCHSYLRIEEAFVGVSGTYTIFTVDPQVMKHFVTKLLDVSARSQPDCMDLSVQSDLLKFIAQKEEAELGISSDRLALAGLIRLDGLQEFKFLILSEKRVYCLNLECVRWPPATCDSSSLADDSIHVKIVHDFSIVDKISEIKIHPEWEKQKLLSSKPNSDSSSVFPSVDYNVFLLSLQACLSTSSSNETSVYGIKSSAVSTCVNYFFFSSAMRDLFLDRLTNLRAELAHTMPDHIREEPEGGNEQWPDADQSSAGADHTTRNRKLHVVPKVDAEDGLAGFSPKSTTSNFSFSSIDERSLGKTAKSGSVYSHSRRKASEDSSIFSGNVNVPLDAGPGYSFSPNSILSSSPLSNFSRASISPPVRQEPLSRPTPRFTSQTEIDSCKAVSLPSSFDWKQFYFKSEIQSSSTIVESNIQSTKNAPSENFSVSEHSKLSENSQTRRKPTLETSSQEGSFTGDDNFFLSRFHGPKDDSETEQEAHLRRCVRSYTLMQTIPPRLKPFALMSGAELQKFFHTHISTHDPGDGGDGLGEDLIHALWSVVVPYTNPKEEIISLVLLSTRGIYLLSDNGVKLGQGSRPSWMTHSRNRSDSAISWSTGDRRSWSSRPGQWAKAYHMFSFEDIHHINIGLFDQCVRLTGSNENSVFTIATRDRVKTETFIRELKKVLSLIVSSPMIERSTQDLEQDFYRSAMQRTMSTVDGHVYTHPSQVTFIYPGDDAIQDMMYLIKEHIGPSKVKSQDVIPASLHLYLLCYLIPLEDGAPPLQRTVIVTGSHICLAEEDIVTFPLPDFVRGLPENPCHKILDCRRIDSLKRVQLYRSNAHWLTLTFCDEVEDIVVDVSMEHFSPSQSKGRQYVTPELSVKLFIQCVKERDKMVSIVERLWKQQVAQVGRILDVNKV